MHLCLSLSGYYIDAFEVIRSSVDLADLITDLKRLCRTDRRNAMDDQAPHHYHADLLQYINGGGDGEDGCLDEASDKEEGDEVALSSHDENIKDIHGSIR